MPQMSYSHKMNFKFIFLFLILIVSVAESNSAISAAKNSITIKGGKFLQNGEPIFLLGISYFDGLSAPQNVLDSDFQFLKERGFNALRVWANWYTEYQPNTLGLIEKDGSINADLLQKLKSFLRMADKNGFVVKLTFSRDATAKIDFTKYKDAIVSVTSEIRSFPNVLLDLQNETDHCGVNDDRGCAGHLTLQQAGVLAEAVKTADPNRLVTVSRTGGGFVEGKDDYKSFLSEAKVDFIATHRPSRTRNSQWAENTAKEVSVARNQIGNDVPVLFDEPNRCGKIVDCKERSAAAQFLTAAKNAKQNGAAGWFFHTSAGFRIHSRPLHERLNPVEKIVVNRLSRTIQE
jgi:Cellulase (glycosyl hydrolase family 5)